MRGDLVEESIVAIGVLLSSVNVLLFLIFVRAVFKTSNIHRNCRLLAFSGSFAYGSLIIGEFSMFLNLAVRNYCVLPGTGVPNCPDLRTIVAVQLNGLFLLEMTSIAVCIERTLATFVDNYEKRSFLCSGIGLVLASHTAALLLSVSYWIWGMSVEVNNMIRVGYNVFCLLYCSALYKYNRRLNVQVHEKGGRLSRRYQLTENERVIRFLFPIILLCCIMAIFLSSAMAYAQYTPFRRLSIPVYWMVLNVYIMICLALAGRRRMMSFFGSRFTQRVDVQLFTEENAVEEHFRTLQKLWL